MLVIHGFGGTPCEVSELVAICNRKKWMVRAPLLPGHGVAASMLGSISYYDWIKHVEYHFLELSNSVDQVAIVGLSMGGLLALRVVETIADPTTPCCLISTPFNIVPSLFRPFITVLGRIGLSVRSKGKDVEGSSDEVLDCQSVGSIPLAAVRQMLLLRDEVLKRLKNVKNPVLIIHSKKDEIISVKDAKQVYMRIGSSQKKLVILEYGGHNLLKDFNRKEVAALIVRWLEQRFPTLRESR